MDHTLEKSIKHNVFEENGNAEACKNNANDLCGQEIKKELPLGSEEYNDGCCSWAAVHEGSPCQPVVSDDVKLETKDLTMDSNIQLEDEDIAVASYYSWAVQEGSSQIESCQPVILDDVKLQTKVSTVDPKIQIKEEDLTIFDSHDGNYELQNILTKEEAIVTSPDRYEEENELQELIQEHNFQCKSDVSPSRDFQYEATKDSDSEDISNDEDFLVEYECKGCGLTFQALKKFEAHYNTCTKLQEMSQKSSKTGAIRVSCHVCGEMVASHRMSFHISHYHSDMVSRFICPSKEKSCPYVSYSKSNMFLHVSRRHADEDISPNIKLEKKLMPNPKMNPDLYSLNKSKGNFKSSVPEGNVRAFHCPLKTCKFLTKNKYSVKRHILTHKREVSSAEFATLASSKIESSVVSENLVQSASDFGVGSDDKPQGVIDFACCGKDFQNYERFSMHMMLTHQSHINVFNCSFEGCSYTNIKQHKTRSHIVVVHAKGLGAKEINKLLLPENIKRKKIPNPKYVPLDKKAAKAECVAVKDESDSDSLHCFKCEKTYSSKRHLQRHFRVYHDRRNIPLIKCPISECTLETSRFASLKCHLYSHVRRKEISKKKLNEIMADL